MEKEATMATTESRAVKITIASDNPSTARK